MVVHGYICKRCLDAYMDVPTSAVPATSGSRSQPRDICRLGLAFQYHLGQTLAHARTLSDSPTAQPDHQLVHTLIDAPRIIEAESGQKDLDLP